MSDLLYVLCASEVVASNKVVASIYISNDFVCKRRRPCCHDIQAILVTRGEMPI